MTPRRLPEGIRKRGQVYYGYWTDEKGKRQEKRLSKDLAIAKRLRAEQIRRVDRVRMGLEDPTLPKKELVPLLAMWVRAIGPSLTRWSAHKERHSAETVIAAMHAEFTGDLTVEALERARGVLIDDGLSNATINAYVNGFRRFSKWLKANGHLWRDPFLEVRGLSERARFRKRLPQRLSVEHGTRLLQAAGKRPIGHVIAIMLGAGLRIREALGLRWADFDGEALHVRASVAKSDKGRVVPIQVSLQERIGRIRAERAKKLGALPGPEDRIILSSYGNPYGYEGARHAFHKARERAGLPLHDSAGRLCCPHALRHTYCTWLIAGGAMPQQVQLLMGHADIKTTMQVYAELDAVSVRPATDLLPDLGQIVGGKSMASEKQRSQVPDESAG